MPGGPGAVQEDVEHDQVPGSEDVRVADRLRDLIDVVLASLDEPLVSVHRKQLGHLGQEKLRTLIHLLEEARSAAE